MLILGLSIACSAGATYFTLTRFPQTIRIDHKGNINVEQSKVFVEGKSMFQTDENIKIIKH